MDIDPEALRYFAAVADHGHFGRAAAALGISRVSLSRAVVELEATLGVELFIRPSERTELSEAGHALRARVPDLLAEAATDAEADDGEAGPAPFRIGYVPGVIVSKWTRTWAERLPDRPLQVVRTEQSEQSEALRTGRLDACFVRLPLDREGLSAIPLYTEVAVVVLPTDHPLADADEVSVIDLVDEHLMQDADTVPQWRDAAAALRTSERRPLPEMRSTADAVALVAAGVGVLVLPMSVARMYRRRDVTSRPISDVDGTNIALAWPTERTSDDVEELIGIVRGRTARSSRGPAAAQPEKAAKTKPKAKAPTAPEGTRSARRRGAPPVARPRRQRGR